MIGFLQQSQEEMKMDMMLMKLSSFWIVDMYLQVNHVGEFLAFLYMDENQRLSECFSI